MYVRSKLPRIAARLVLATLLPVLLVAATAAPEGGETDHGVYVLLVAEADGSVDDVTARLTGSLESHGWQVLSTHATGVPEGCRYGARVVTVHSPGYSNTLEPYGLQTAFAAPLRLVVFEDENGVHVGATNMLNLNRTIVDERVPAEAWRPWSHRLSGAVSAAFPEASVQRDYGQVRGEGRIGKTFGIMAGGPFVEKIETVTSVPAAGTTVGEVAQRLREGFGDALADGEWALDALYLLELPGLDAAVVGVSGAPMEATAFRIVGHGGDDRRKDMTCPGLDHAPAFPVELLVARSGDEIVVRLVDEMFRMKMFFEDAGTMAFARNMGMPGSIEDEIRSRIEATLR